MSSMLDHLLVALLVLAALIYAVMSLGPKLLRARLLETLGVTFERGARLPGLGVLGRRFRAAAERKQPGCGSGCDGCGSAASGAPGQATEITIPIRKIGRRT